MKRLALLFCVLACAGSISSQAPPAPPVVAPPPGPGAAPAPGGRPAGAPTVRATPYDFNNHPGWTSMFDGKTLNGWDGPKDLWHVEDGTITVSGTDANPIGSVYLYWTGGEVKDFEFKTEIKLGGGSSNSGIQFRAIRLGKTDKKNSEWESRGYQADYTQSPGSMIECCNGPRRGIPPRPGDSARVGTVTQSALAPGLQPTILATLGDPAELEKFVRKGDWNEVHLIVRGRIMQYIINGHLMSEFLDDNPDPFTDHGEIAVQLEGRGDISVAFRNMWIKPLP